MEEKKDSTKQSHQQEQTEEEKPDEQVLEAVDHEEKVIPMLEKNQLPEDTDQKERHENKVDISVGSSKLSGKDGERRQTNSSKKSKEGSKRNAKELKHTVPQPFSFATDKRMSKERRSSSMDFSAPNEERRSTEKRGSIDFKAAHNPNYRNLSV